MILLIHIIIALSSLGVATFAFARPSSQKLRLSHGFAGGTFLSGVALIISGASLIHACISGITFLSTVLAINEFTRRKIKNLQTQEQ